MGQATGQGSGTRTWVVELAQLVSNNQVAWEPWGNSICICGQYF